MDYDFLFDKVRRQLVIGYNVGERRCDSSYYDLLASEARLCNFVAIAQGNCRREAGLRSGRLLTTAGRRAGSSIVERLHVRVPHAAARDADLTKIRCSIRPTRPRWSDRSNTESIVASLGMSESGYSTVDVNLNYQYRAFGVPGLGLKRGLGEDLVVAPYASALALMVAPEAACRNSAASRRQRISRTPRIVRGHRLHAIPAAPRRVERRGPVSYMAHHQAMSLLSFAYLLLGAADAKALRVRPAFSGDVAAAQERIPRATFFSSHATELSGLRAAGEGPNRRCAC